MKYLILGIGVLIIFLIGYNIFYCNQDIGNTLLLGISSSLFATVIFEGTLYILFLRKNHIPYRLWIALLIFKNRDIRVSMAYLFSIKIDGKFLLLRGENERKRIQPIGGVYKHYYTCSDFLKQINAHPACEVESHTDHDQDLRLSIPIARFREFFKWFLNGTGREHNVLRELHEEVFMGATQKNTIQMMSLIMHKCKSIAKFNGYDKANNYYRFYYFDIFAIEVDADKSKIGLFKEQMNRNKNLLLVTRDEIIKGEHDGWRISDTAEYIV